LGPLGSAFCLGPHRFDSHTLPGTEAASPPVRGSAASARLGAGWSRPATPDPQLRSYLVRRTGGWGGDGPVVVRGREGGKGEGFEFKCVKQVASTTGRAGCLPSRSQALRAKQVACQAGRKHYGPSRLLAKQVASTTGRKHYGPSRLQEWRAGEGGRGGNAHPFMPYDDV
jgi:hypothetical protein